MVDSAVQATLVDAATLALSGELSFASVTAVWQQAEGILRQAQPRQLDLAAVTRADSAGLACVLAILAQVRGRGEAMGVVHAPAGLRALARVCEVQSLLQAA